MCNKPVLIECSGDVDLFIVLDSSGSVGERRFNILKLFISSLLDSLNIGDDKTRVGMMTFSDHPKVF